MTLRSLLGFFPTDTFTPILSSSSQALALTSLLESMATRVVFTLPGARLTDVVSGALGGGARKPESSVIISCRPGSDQNYGGSSPECHWEPQTTGGRGLLLLDSTTLRTYFWQNSVEMLAEKSHCSFHVPLSSGPLLKSGLHLFYHWTSGIAPMRSCRVLALL